MTLNRGGALYRFIVTAQLKLLIQVAIFSLEIDPLQIAKLLKARTFLGDPAGLKYAITPRKEAHYTQRKITAQVLYENIR
jgi:hypothetical protein